MNRISLDGRTRRSVRQVRRGAGERPGSGRRNLGGFTLLEGMVALVILGLVVLAYLQTISASTRSVESAERWSRAVVYAEQLMEGFKIDGDAPPAGSPEQLEGGFSRWLEIKPWQGGLMRATAVVRMPDGAEFRLDRLYWPGQ